MAEKLKWLCRFFNTAMGFLIWGIAGILLQLALYPYVRSHRVHSLHRQLKVRRCVGRIWHYFIRYLSFTGVLKVNYQGFEQLGRAGQLILPNHPSLLDVVLILSKVPSLNCIVKKDLLNNPTMRNQILACGFLPNTESVELLEKSNAVLQEQTLLLFAEGTRTGWDGVVKLNRGAVSIGLRSAKVITPVVIRMHPLSLKKGHPWYRIPKELIQYDLIVGEDIDPQDWLQNHEIPIASRRLTKYLEDYFNSQTKDNKNGTGTTN